MKFHSLVSSSFLLFAITSACAEPNFALKENQEKPESILPVKEAKTLSTRPESATTLPAATATLHSMSAPAATHLPTSSQAELFDTREIKFHADDTIWKKVSNDDGVLTFSERSPRTNVVAFRGEMRIPSSLKRVAAVLSDPTIRKEWVDALLETRTVELVSSMERLEYNHTQVPWPFHDRDFLYRVKVKVNPEPAAMLITIASEQDAREPPLDGIVRGQILHAFYYMKEVPGIQPLTDVVIEMAVDPKGVIPLWMVNLTQKRWPHHTLLALKKRAVGPDLVVPKDIQDYFNPIPPGGRK